MSDKLKNIVVIGYGNSLRSDDGAGQKVADIIAAWKLPHVKAIATHQLTPELVDILATVDLAIFVDAYPSSTTQNLQVHPLKLAQSSITTSHWCEPQLLLAIAQVLYGYHPQAYLVAIPGINFNLGEVLSPIAERGIQAALLQINDLIKSGRIEQCMKLE